MRRTASIDGPDPIDKYVGSRVRARRLGMRLSQTELGKEIGVTFQQIQKYENAANRVSASSLYKIAEVLGVDVAYFYEGMPKPSAASKKKRGSGLEEATATFEHDPMSDPRAIELMHNFFRISDEQVRQRLFQLVRTLAKKISSS